MLEIGMELKLARISKGLKQSDLKEALGIAQCVVSRIENGGAEAYPDETAKLQQFFGSERDDEEDKSE